MNKLLSTLKRLYRFGYTAQIMSFNDIAESCSRDLLHSITKSGHCLHKLSVQTVYALVDMIMRCLFS